MSTLSTHLSRLFRWLAEVGIEPPSHDVRIAEVQANESNSSDGRYHVWRDDLQKPMDYEARFEELIGMGHPWLNMSCFGVYEGLLIVVIEVPSLRALYHGCVTSVNLSGPTRIVLEHQWHIDSVLTIE